MAATPSIVTSPIVSLSLALARLSDAAAINLFWLIGSVQVAGLLITLPGMGFLQRSMVNQINRTQRYAPVKPMWHLGIAQCSELETVYRNLFPDSWKADIYGVLRSLSISMGGIWALAYTGSKILHVYAHQGPQP
ncbi:hypothetical protein SAMN05421819_4174 [Bryocella elongata]|uniref:Uncharacterized protein n=1 Tax=Bryocella elongata TaxID=863522 RepID=A0A1H6C1V5_9BACT|nr:hypothetical protein [Bryocella elongata]SEG66938.1 hypothetical protein SAMN05421819_4174 [Bryocella elongata]